MADPNATLWERVDERVLRWVFSLAPTLEHMLYTLQEREPIPDDDIPGLDSREINESLHRLASHGLIDGKPQSTSHDTSWSHLRITAQGLRVLGEWPDLDLVASAATFHHVLRKLAEDAPDEEKSALVRAAGSVGRTADAVVQGTVTNIAGSLGKEATGE
jgi:hypothetical protein